MTIRRGRTVLSAIAVRISNLATGAASARSTASRPTGAVKAMRMKKRPVLGSPNCALSVMLAPIAASSVVTEATIEGRSRQDRVRT